MSLVFYRMIIQMEIGLCIFVNGIHRLIIHVQPCLEQEIVLLVYRYPESHVMYISK